MCEPGNGILIRMGTELRWLHCYSDSFRPWHTPVSVRQTQEAVCSGRGKVCQRHSASAVRVDDPDVDSSVGISGIGSVQRAAGIEHDLGTVRGSDYSAETVCPIGSQLGHGGRA